MFRCPPLSLLIAALCLCFVVACSSDESAPIADARGEDVVADAGLHDLADDLGEDAGSDLAMDTSLPTPDKGPASDGGGYATGHKSFSVTIPGGAVVPLQAYYPATTAGNDTPVASGAFPVLLFGHGYQQSYLDYAYLWRALVPRGVIVILHDRFTLTPTINIDTYTADLVGVLSYLAGPAQSAGAPFAGHLSGDVGIAGHSTGGGASVLAAVAAKTAGSAEPKALMLLAPLGTTNPLIHGTNPHAVAPQLQKPLLVLDGAQDCLAKVPENSKLIYDKTPGSAAAPKWRVTITEGDHCGYSDCAGPGKLKCEGGEALGCAMLQGKTILPCDQNRLVEELMVSWFLWRVVGETSAAGRFTQALQDARVSTEASP